MMTRMQNRDDQGLDGLADQDQHRLLDQALVDLLQEAATNSLPTTSPDR